MKRRHWINCIVVAIVAVVAGSTTACRQSTADQADIDAFAAAVGDLAKEIGLPGMSAAIVRDGEMVWSAGYGHADVERNILARADTPYRLASLSKPFAAVILMQLMEEGRVELDGPMRDFAVHAWFEPGGGSWAHYPSRYDDGTITVRHILTHTSQSEPPGSAYAYSGNIFGDLTWVIEDAAGQSYPVAVRDRILKPLQMNRSCPGQLAPWCDEVVGALAKPYDISNDSLVAGTYPGFGVDSDADVTAWGLDPAYRLPATTQDARRKRLGSSFTRLFSSQSAAGMISSVEDLAKFDIALDGNRLVSKQSRELMFTAARTPDGDELPYGLGWFVEDNDGTKLVWHYGWYPPTVSALYIKVPSRRLSLILLSNCDGLSAGVSWSALGVKASPFARLFLEHFAGN